MHTFNLIFFGLYLTLFATPIIAVVARKILAPYDSKLFLITLVSVALVFICMWFKVSLFRCSRGCSYTLPYLCIIRLMCGPVYKAEKYRSENDGYRQFYTIFGSTTFIPASSFLFLALQ